ncbi:hypothetical protein OHC33_005304 [Knufia fluminis]|uniref:Uncharacterized protein n=1 Tax=Knufia fluminis TaxID=191047 RepID=A0AAN8I8T6_9EURO|nr:hypothetical protein OHC33_005304 [Knufia fluminis]
MEGKPRYDQNMVSDFPANLCRALDIPPGRVAQQLQAFQAMPRSPAAPEKEPKEPKEPKETPKAPHSTPFEPTPHAITPNLGEEKPGVPNVPPVTQQVKQEVEGEDHEVKARGRTRHRDPQPEVASEDEDQVDEVLEDLRSRLFSVQNIVRRERSGSSQARDDMMDELGSMLDNAIATTLSPLARSPRAPPRSSSSKRPSPTKHSLPQSQPSRSQSLKPANPSPRSIHRPDFSLQSSPETAIKFREPLPTPALPRQLFDKDVKLQRQRQTSEPLFFTARRTGFPLSSPVRERALLWESMSRGTIAEHDTSKSSPHVAQFHSVPPEQTNEAPPKPATPPIPLALPQFVDAEKRQQEARLEEEAATGPTEEDSQPASDLEPFQQTTSTEWPGSLRLKEVGVGTPTVQETPSFAQAAEHDEHHQKPRPSVVRTTIKDLLSATRRRVSGKNAQVQSPAAGKDDSALVRESELRASIADLESIDAHHLPPLQVSPDEVAKIQSTDGTNSLGKAPSRSSTFSRKFAAPPEQKSRSPVKPTPTTPVRGRPRETHSPGGRPYAVDQRFALSPSRSNSRGSRGSLTFNIKARVSPGRGRGKDDTELFVTANIESDGSDEGS